MNTPAEPASSSGGVRVFLHDGSDPALVEGHPALFCAATMKLMERPTSFLIEHYVRSGKRASPRTWRNAAHALKTWFEFLAAAGVSSGEEAAFEDFCDYRTLYQRGISDRGEPYSDGTIAGRMFVILGFYDYAAKRGWYDGTLTTRAVSRAKAGGNGASALAHIHGPRRDDFTSDAIPRVRSKNSDIRPFSTSELRVFLPALGPRATDRGSDSRSSRDRLIGDIGLFAGFRLDEINQLLVYQFLALTPDPAKPLTDQPVTIRRKGGFKQTVAMPTWLVCDILTFIESERAEWLKLARLHKRPPANLFLGNEKSNACGRPLGHRRMEQIIGEACLRSGITKIERITDPETGDTVEQLKPKHSTHDLRHTFAVLTYWARVRDGDAEPWKFIQTQLGHKNLQTTIDVYLRHVQLFSDQAPVGNMRQLIGL